MNDRIIFEKLKMPQALGLTLQSIIDDAFDNNPCIEHKDDLLIERKFQLKYIEFDSTREHIIITCERKKEDEDAHTE